MIFLKFLFLILIVFPFAIFLVMILDKLKKESLLVNKHMHEESKKHDQISSRRIHNRHKTRIKKNE